MDKHLDKIIRKYTRATRRLLICPKSYRCRLISDMEKDIEQFITENNPDGESDIIRYFGTPAELAQTYLDSIPQDELADYKSRRKSRITIISTVLITLFVCCIFFLFIELWKSSKINVIYVEESIEILDERTE